ncbi:MAG TPA: DUF4349 domain-containing protein [Gemmatimonadaceae bacterium]
MIRRWSFALALATLSLACNRAPERAATSAASDTAAGVSPTAPVPSAASVRAPAFRAESGEPAGTGLFSTGDIHAPDSLPAAMIIRAGQARIQVDSLAGAVTGVRQVAARVGGYVANVTMQAGGRETHEATLEIKLPAARFDDALAGLRSIGSVETVNVTAEDVGEEYVDVSARVANARRLEERLVQLLATRTGKLADVLAVERELARVREEIERYDGRLRYLRTRAAISTLAVTVHEPLPIVGERGSGSVLAESFRQAWRNFVGFVAGFIAALGTLVPLTILITGVALGATKGLRRLRAQG